MSLEAQREEIRLFFDRPGESVAASLANRWMKHPFRRAEEIFDGEDQIVGLQTNTGVKYYLIEEVVLYSDRYTRERWPYSRGPEIAAMESGEVIGYRSQGGHVLTFIKTQGAENIQLSALKEIDRLGDSLPENEGLLTSSMVAPLLGLRHKEHAQLAPFNFRGRRALLIATGVRVPTDEELRRIEEDLLS